MGCRTSRRPFLEASGVHVLQLVYNTRGTHAPARSSAPTCGSVVAGELSWKQFLAILVAKVCRKNSPAFNIRVS